jgi:hypothetical protein
MGLEPLLQDPQLNEEQIELRSQFFSATGYGPSDLLSLNYETKEFLTRNGGHYRLVDGIQHLSGPSPYLEDRWDF